MREFVYQPLIGEAIDSILTEYIDAHTLQVNESMGSKEKRFLLEASASLLENLCSCGVSHNDIHAENLL